MSHKLPFARRLPRLGVVTALLLTCAVQTPGWTMNLQQAYEAALRGDPTLRSAKASVDVASARVDVAKAQRLPSLTFSASRNFNDLARTQNNLLGQPSTTSETYYSQSQSLSLRQPIYRKALGIGVEQAEFGVREAQASMDKEMQNLAVRVVSAYMEVLLADDQLGLMKAQIESTTTQLKAAQRALAAGSGTRTDIDEAQARLDQALAYELEVKQQAQYARRQLEVLVDQPVTQLVTLEPARLGQVAGVSGDVALWVERAVANSPEVAALAARREAALLEVQRSDAAHYPTLDAVAQVVRSASENVTSPSSRYTNRIVGLQLSVPLYQGGGISATVRQAMADMTRIEEQLEALKRELGVRVHREHRTVTEGILRIRAFEQALASAEQLEKSTRRSFSAGSRTWVDVLNAEEKRQRAARDLAEARYIFLVAKVRLHALAGEEKGKIIEEINTVLGPVGG
jgi:protease secretion system outer membrane protein